MLKVIHECKSPEILIITPLLKTDNILHNISRETKISIKRNDIPYVWCSYSNKFRHAHNCQLGVEAFHNQYNFLPKYLFILDRDIICGRNMLDKLYRTLSATTENIGYSYCGFEYKGYINVKIPPTLWSHTQLRLQNYISSNSLYKTDMWKKVGGFVIDEDTHRLSDWAFWLKAAKMGYKGILNSSVSFIAMSTEKDISAGGREEYNRTKELIIERYIK